MFARLALRAVSNWRQRSTPGSLFFSLAERLRGVANLARERHALLAAGPRPRPGRAGIPANWTPRRPRCASRRRSSPRPGGGPGRLRQGHRGPHPRRGGPGRGRTAARRPGPRRRGPRRPAGQAARPGGGRPQPRRGQRGGGGPACGRHRAGQVPARFAQREHEEAQELAGAGTDEAGQAWPRRGRRLDRGPGRRGNATTNISSGPSRQNSARRRRRRRRPWPGPARGQSRHHTALIGLGSKQGKVRVVAQSTIMPDARVSHMIMTRLVLPSRMRQPCRLSPSPRPAEVPKSPATRNLNLDFARSLAA